MVDVGRALAHPTRVRLLALLAGGELCVCQTVAILEQAASTISEHLSDLKRAGLVQERRAGKLVFYRLADDHTLRAYAKGVVDRVADDPVIARDRALVARLRKIDVADLCAADLDLEALGVDLRDPTPELGAKRRVASRQWKPTKGGQPS